MLNREEIEKWFHCLKLSEKTIGVIEEIRSSEPLRKVSGGPGNVSGEYSSHKMGLTIQFESHTVELAAIELFYEYDSDVLEYWDQAFALTLKFASASGRNGTHKHIPDFFVLRQDSVGFEEWKPEKSLEKLAVKQPNRFSRGEDGCWHSPPAQEQAQKLGFYYRLRTDAEIDWVKYRNIKYLRGYLDKNYIVDAQAKTAVLSVVTSNPGISFSQLRQEVKDVANVDDINALIATKQLYVDFSAAPLKEQQRVHIFRDRSIAQAYAIVVDSRTRSVTESLQVIDVEVGSSLIWDGKGFTLELIGENKIMLRGEEGLICWTHAEFQKLVELGEIKGLQTQETPSISSVGWQFFLQAGPEALAKANERYQAIAPYLRGQLPLPDEKVYSDRTIRDWKAKYNKAQQEHGCGLIGLIDQRKGNPTPIYSDKALEFVDKIIEEQYETAIQKSIWATYQYLKDGWEPGGMIGPVPSHEFFYKRVKLRSGYEQTKKRQGIRAANQKLAPWLIESTTPRHGDRPFEIVHIDHTLLDIEIVCSYTGVNLGRPWITAMIDAYTRRILAVYITFDPPSYRSCMMVLRICVQRFGRFPETVVVDNAKEFKSVYFDTLLARFGATKKHRPKNLPKFSSIIERWFGGTNTQFLYNLRGNTQITKYIRLVNKTNNPKNLAIWTLDEFYDYFAYGYCYGVYDRKQHPALEGLSPQEAFALGLAHSGSRPHQTVKYDEQFRILTLPSTKKGTAKVQPGTGVRINYQDYWSEDDSFLNPEVEGKQVPVRYEPFDYGIAYAFVMKHWVRCLSNYYSKFQGYSERAVMIATTILSRKRQLHGIGTQSSADEIIHLLKNAEEHQELMLQLRRDQAAKDVRDLIEGKSVSPTLPSTSISLLNAGDVPEDDFDEFADDELESSYDIDPNDIKPYDDEELWR
jgi:transposase InsO family protein